MALPWLLIRYGTNGVIPSNPATAGGPPPWGLIGYGTSGTAVTPPTPEPGFSGGGWSKELDRERFMLRRRKWREEALAAQEAAEERAREIKKASDRKAALKATSEAKEAIEAAYGPLQVETLVSELNALANALKPAHAVNEAKRIYEEAARILREQEDEEEAIMLLFQ